jgi:predicted DNA-binding transcriptional regulator YafY
MDPRSALAVDEGSIPRQRAVAHLWGWCGWSVQQLGQLFGVSDRTIKRDLRAARAAGVVPRRSRGSAASLIRQARSLLGTCARLRETVGAASEGGSPDDASILWAAALQARLLAEERKLLALIAAIPGASCVRLAEENELPEYLAPDLLRAVAEIARAESRGGPTSPSQEDAVPKRR